MSLEVTFLGTGTSQGVPVIACHCEVCRSMDARDKRLRSSVLLRQNGVSVVIDTGPDFRQQMLAKGQESLDAVVLTHEHKDHIAGLDDVRAFNFSQNGHMEVYGTARVNDALRREFHYVFSGDDYPGIPKINLNEIGNKPFFIKGMEFIPIEVMHYKMPVLGFRVGNFTYITDAKSISTQELKKMEGSELIDLNAQRRHEHIAHFTLTEAVELMKSMKPKQGYFTHISHYLGRHEAVNRELGPGIELAYDGLVIEL